MHVVRTGSFGAVGGIGGCEAWSGGAGAGAGDRRTVVRRGGRDGEEFVVVVVVVEVNVEVVKDVGCSTGLGWSWSGRVAHVGLGVGVGEGEALGRGSLRCRVNESWGGRGMGSEGLLDVGETLFSVRHSGEGAGRGGSR